MIHKDPWSSTDGRNYYTAILGYDDPYTLVSEGEVLACSALGHALL
jgi:hypothetical protein